jgi:hypothetical protein
MRIAWKQMTVAPALAAGPALAAAIMIAVTPTASAATASAQQMASPAVAAGLHASPAHGWCPWHGHWCPGPSSVV